MKSAPGWHRKKRSAADLDRKREYNSAEYKAARRALAQQVAAGTACCWRCRRFIPPGSAWHVGHDDWDRRIIRGPEHARCNLSAAATKAALITNARRRAARQSRDWFS